MANDGGWPRAFLGLPPGLSLPDGLPGLVYVAADLPPGGRRYMMQPMIAARLLQAAMVDTGLLGWDDVARVLSPKPAEIGRPVGYAPPFTVGAPAPRPLTDPSPRPVFSVDDRHGPSVNSPSPSTTRGPALRPGLGRAPCGGSGRGGAAP